jgi:hypothetical protein
VGHSQAWHAHWAGGACGACLLVLCMLAGGTCVSTRQGFAECILQAVLQDARLPATLLVAARVTQRSTLGV